MKSTKKALILSVISLLACVSMLVGSTFAWFTDSVTSANNIIKSGNLDIVLEYATFNEDGTFKAWKDVSGASDILTNELFEPGVVEVAYLRVANAGSLALKYQLGVNIISETPGVNVAGEEFKLSDYIQFGVVELDTFATYANRAAAVAAVTEAKKISAGYTKASNMIAGAEAYLALVVYMPETVGNEANFKTGTDAPQIDLGINVYATQYTAENDSFNNQYDKYASVATLAEMKNLLADGHNSFNFMGNEINLSYGLSKAMVPAGSTIIISNAVVSGKSYGNAADGTVIFENCTFTNTGAYSIHFDAGNGDVIFKNCELYGWNSFGASLNSVSFYDCALYGNGTYGLIRSYADLYMENCYIDTTNANHSDNYSEGIEAVSGATLTEKNNTYVATTLSEVMALAKKGNTTIDAKGANLGDYYYNGTFANGTVLKNAKFTYVYGASIDGLATFENCQFVSNHSYSANFSDGSYTGKAVFNNCLFDGWSSFGDAITAVEMNGCTFEWNNPYSMLRFYQNAVLTDCDFVSIEGIDTNKTGTVVEFVNCTGIEGKIYNNGTAVGTWIVDGTDISDTITSW